MQIIFIERRMIVTKEELDEIKNSIELKMIAEQNCEHRNEYSISLQREINLYNAVVDLQDKVDTALRLLKAFGGGEIIISDVIDVLEEKND